MKKILIIALLLFASTWVWSRYGYLINNLNNIPNNTKIDLSPTNIKISPSDPLLDYINLPSGFNISYFANEVPGARSLTLGKENTVYVGTRDKGVVYAMEDKNQDGVAEIRYVVASDLNAPNGVAYINGDLYVAEATRIIKFSNIDSTYDSGPDYSVIYSNFPDERQHSWKYLAAGPDNKLYVSIGMPCNVCEKFDPFGSIMQINIDGSSPTIIARGIRNSVGFDWNPLDQSLWFTDNGRDSMGDDIPGDELNRISKNNENFGFPYCHAGSILDPVYGKSKSCSDYASPATVLGPHVAALGAKFYRGNMFPDIYNNKIFIAEHGSWNRKEPIGYRISTVDIQGDKATNYKTFAEGWLDKDDKTKGRPVDMLELSDGSLLISDDFAGVIYRITYQVE